MGVDQGNLSEDRGERIMPVSVTEYESGEQITEAVRAINADKERVAAAIDAAHLLWGPEERITIHNIVTDEEIEATVRPFTCNVDVRVLGTDIPSGKHYAWTFEDGPSDWGAVEHGGWGLCNLQDIDGGKTRWSSYISEGAAREYGIHLTMMDKLAESDLIHRPIPITVSLYVAAIADTLGIPHAVADDAKVSEADGGREDDRRVYVSSKSDLPQLDACIPDKHREPNSKVSNAVFVPQDSESWLVLPTGGGNVKVVVGDLTNDGDIAPSFDLDSLDRRIVAAVYTLQSEGVRFTSRGLIVQELGYTPTHDNKLEIGRRVTKLMGKWADIDASGQRVQNEPAAEVIDPITGQKVTPRRMKRSVLPLSEWVFVTETGEELIRYEILGTPPTAWHAELTGEVLTYDRDRYIEVAPIGEDGKPIVQRRQSKQQANLKIVISNRVCSLRHASKKSHIDEFITWDKLFELAGIKIGGRTTKKRYMDFTTAYLRALKRSRDIYDFEIVTGDRQSRRSKGVRIIVRKPKPADKR